MTSLINYSQLAHPHPLATEYHCSLQCDSRHPLSH